MASTLSPPEVAEHDFRKVAILFSGGPAPGANAVISTASVSFLRNGIEVLGIKHGYSGLMQFCEGRPMEVDRDYINITHKVLKRTRNSQGIIIGTSRANPGKDVSHPDHLSNPECVEPLQTVYDALCSLGVDGLVSIGGDDTLKTANKFKLFQDQMPAGSHRIPVVHLPKTIDNDYMGIDFTFGYFTAVETLAEEIRNLLYDAEAGQAYFLCETMGRSAGWLSYGAAIAGEASLVISVEDIAGPYEDTEEVTDPVTHQTKTRKIMNMDAVVNRIVAMMRTREDHEGKRSGVIVMAEGLAEMLPYKYLDGVPRDPHGHIRIAEVNLGNMFSKLVSKEFERQTGHHRRVTGLQLGYESRCARPLAFDVMLGSQLGVGSFRAMVEKRLDGVMVSVTGQLDLRFVPFEQLVNPENLVTVVRYVEPDSDFHKLARFLETYVNEEEFSGVTARVAIEKK